MKSFIPLLCTFSLLNISWLLVSLWWYRVQLATRKRSVGRTSVNLLWSLFEDKLQTIYCDPALRINYRQMESRSFVWKALVIYDSSKLNLAIQRISHLWNSCKTCSSSSQEERSQPNYGLNAARILREQKPSHLMLFSMFQATPSENKYLVYFSGTWGLLKVFGHGHGQDVVMVIEACLRFKSVTLVITHRPWNV